MISVSLLCNLKRELIRHGLTMTTVRKPCPFTEP